MRFALPAWPLPQVCIPAGTIIDVEARDGEIVGPVVWNGHVLPMPPPMEACGLDEEAALYLLRAYPEFWYRLGFGPDVDREAILAKALAKIAAGEWPHWS